jgi:hypothetical protein
MSARRPTIRRVAYVMLASAAFIAFTAVDAATAAEPPTPSTLDRPVADFAAIDGEGTGPPRLLTLDTDDQPPGAARVALLDRSPTAGWQLTRAETISLLDPAEDPETPWLVALGPDRYVVIVASHEQATTVIARIEINPEGAGSLELGAPVRLPLAVDDAGAIDVDGDGTVELVVAAPETSRVGDGCSRSTLHVLDGETLAERAAWPVPNTRLAGGLLGEWDGRPGGDLLVYTYDWCNPAVAGPTDSTGLTAIRLADGSTIMTRPPENPGTTARPPGIPLAADFDGDGRDEAVIVDAGELVVLEPARGWAQTAVASGDVWPLLAIGRGPDRAAAAVSLVWVDVGDRSELVMVLGSVERAGDGSFAVGERRFDLAGVAPRRRSRAIQSIRDLATTQAPPQAWLGDIDGDGCPDAVGTLLTIQCPARPDPPVKVGAAWFATRPVLSYDVAGSAELLVAATMEWDPALGGPLAATPSAVLRPGAWRHGPSPRFALSEVRAADAAYFSTFPVPRPTIERAPVRGQATDFPGFTGSRILLRVVAAQPDDLPPSAAPGLDEFLASPPSSGEVIAVERVPVPAGAESGRDGSFIHVSLPRGPDGAPAERWTVTIAQLNDWGEVAGPVRSSIVSDLSGPTLTIDPPFLSLPWPLAATVHGRSEPGVEVTGATGGPVKADRRGRFELQTELAPWPQTVELTAIDESGNVTVGRFSLVGGIDYQAFPWGAILVVVLLVGAVLSTGRGSRVVRVRLSETYPDIDPQPEIEELPPGSQPSPAEQWRRARP